MYLSTMYCMNVIWVFLPEINFTYLLTYFSQNHGQISWIPGKNRNLPPPPPNSLFNNTLNHVCDWSRVTGCTDPTSQCVYDWSRVTVCAVCEGDVLCVRAVYCVVGLCNVW